MKTNKTDGEPFEPSAIDFYNWKELDRMRKKRACQEIKLIKQAASGDAQAKKALQRHWRQDAILKKKARNTGYCWY